MTTEPIDIEATLAKRLYGQTEAGNAMDAEIAHRVFGRDIVYLHSLDFRDRGWRYGDEHSDGRWVLPAYSTDIAAAWTIIEHIGASWIFSKRQRFAAALKEAGRLKELPMVQRWVAWPDMLWMFGRGDFPPFPLAICRAALAACVGPGPTGAEVH